jgi:TRAP-type C4-dicarboxylate transport system permease small subunit
MEKAIAFFKKVTTVLTVIITALAAAIIALDVLSLFIESVGRYLLGSSRAFMEEFPRLLVPFFVFPMMSVLYKSGRHISVDLLPNRLSSRYKIMLRIVVGAVVLGVAVEMIIAGMSAVSHFKMMGLMSVTEWTLPMWWIYLSFPLGFGLLAIFALVSIISDSWQLFLVMKKDQSKLIDIQEEEP